MPTPPTAIMTVPGWSMLSTFLLRRPHIARERYGRINALPASEDLGGHMSGNMADYILRYVKCGSFVAFHDKWERRPGEHMRAWALDGHPPTAWWCHKGDLNAEDEQRTVVIPHWRCQVAAIKPVGTSDRECYADVSEKSMLMQMWWWRASRIMQDMRIHIIRPLPTRTGQSQRAGDELHIRIPSAELHGPYLGRIFYPVCEDLLRPPQSVLRSVHVYGIYMKPR